MQDVQQLFFWFQTPLPLQCRRATLTQLNHLHHQNPPSNKQTALTWTIAYTSEEEEEEEEKLYLKSVFVKTRNISVEKHFSPTKMKRNDDIYKEMKDNYNAIVLKMEATKWTRELYIDIVKYFRLKKIKNNNTCKYLLTCSGIIIFYFLLGKTILLITPLLNSHICIYEN